MTSAVNAEHLCFILNVIRKYSFVYITDNQEVYISVFNLRGKKDHTTFRAQGSNKLQMQDFSLFFLFCNHGKTIEMNFP